MDLISFRHVLPRSWRKRLLPHWDRALAREQNFWETRFYREFIQPGDLVLDIGANVGLKTSVFLQLGARVVAAEPNPVCADLIRKSCKHALTLGELIIEEVALGSERGTTTLHLAEHDSTVTSASPTFIAATQTAEVRFTSTIEADVLLIDDLIERYGKPAFIKIDVEGMDYDALRGLSYRPAALSFEFNTNPLLWEQTKLSLKEAGRLGFQHANFSGSGTAELQLKNWRPISEIAHALEQWADGRETFGDLLVR